MTMEEIMRAVCGADKETLAAVARVLRHEDAHAASTEAEARLITQREAARRLGVSVTTVWRLIGDGSLAVVSVRGKRRVSLASVLAFAGVSA